MRRTRQIETRVRPGRGRVRQRLEEIGDTMNLVAQVFDGDVEKAVAWFQTRNPLLGGVAPRDMIRLGRYERLRKVIGTMTEQRTLAPPGAR